MRFPLDGSVELYFTHSPEERPRSVSNVSCDKSPCAIASWDSYENINFAVEQVDEPGKVSSMFLYFLLLIRTSSWPLDMLRVGRLFAFASDVLFLLLSFYCYDYLVFY